MNIPDQAIQAAAEALAELEPGEDWPSNTDLGGHALLGTRDDEFKWAMEQDAERALTAALPYLEAALRTQIAAEDNSGRPDAIDPDWREKIAIALQERKAARQQKGTTK